ncbi:ComEA family DNA-binding protein [Streptomyces sp. NPDC049837]|uniref:ComEA family DNA-binding protein n=1 Tax=Streptomyces sp. NPDC049837 TaxID=3155277 RepID=UPI0034497BED
MATRTHSVTTTSRVVRAASGPGRAAGSDGRTRGRGPSSRHRVRGRRTAAVRATVTARRRADALFEEAGTHATHPPPAGGQVPGPPGGAPHPVAGARPAGGRPVPGAAADAEGAGGGAEETLGRRERWRHGLRDRLPLWVQARCGMEPRTVAALAVVLVVAAVLAGRYFWVGRPEPVRAPDVVTEAAPPAAAATGAATPGVSAGAPPVVVDVSGKVRRPGVLRLPAGSRVADALRAAGGVRPGTDLTGLNRARVLMDGEQVVVGAPPGPAGQVTSGASGPGGDAGGPVSLNTATVEQLDTLPGVGPVLAQHIVDYRTSHGGFRSVDELREVNGIGERRFADLQPLVRP